MKSYRSLALLLFVPFLVASQQLTGPELLEKAIAYHDPEGNWKSFSGDLKITMQTPNSSNRVSSIHLDVPKQRFALEVSKDEDAYAYRFKGDTCHMELNGSDQIAEEDKKRLRLSCDRGTMMRNYYTYLYGLPMKLNDPGTQLDNKVMQKQFKGKDYLVLKVNYDENVGKDTWYFYFDPQTYAMEVYQFYHDERKNDGEYILLSGLEDINGVRMPKTRKWYYNKDDKYLGTDVLN